MDSRQGYRKETTEQFRCMGFIDFKKKKKSCCFKTVVCRRTHVHRGYGRSHPPAPSPRSEHWSLPLPAGQEGDGCSIRHRVMQDHLCQVDKPGRLLPACPPARSLCLHLLYVQYSGARWCRGPLPAGVQHAPRACGRRPLCQRNRSGCES